MAKRTIPIIHVPNQVLRTKSEPVSSITQEIAQFINSLGKTLQKTSNPKGVGLAAPQVARSLRIFSTNLENNLRIFINPVFIDKSTKQTFGENPKDPIYEGCLSIPGLYGPVPRFEWVVCQYNVIKNGSLKQETARFEAYEARVMQHELDHLDGILFTDYSLQFDLPVYQEVDANKPYREIDKTILESF